MKKAHFIIFCFVSFLALGQEVQAQVNLFGEANFLAERTGLEQGSDVKPSKPSSPTGLEKESGDSARQNPYLQSEAFSFGGGAGIYNAVERYNGVKPRGWWLAVQMAYRPFKTKLFGGELSFGPFLQANYGAGRTRTFKWKVRSFQIGPDCLFQKEVSVLDTFQMEVATGYEYRVENGDSRTSTYDSTEKNHLWFVNFSFALFRKYTNWFSFGQIDCRWKIDFDRSKESPFTPQDRPEKRDSLDCDATLGIYYWEPHPLFDVEFCFFGGVAYSRQDHSSFTKVGGQLIFLQGVLRVTAGHAFGRNAGDQFFASFWIDGYSLIQYVKRVSGYKPEGDDSAPQTDFSL